MFLWNSNTNNTVHTLSIVETNDALLEKAIEAGAEKIISLLDSNIRDDSLYLLFEWDPLAAQLSASITDASKQMDSPQRIICDFPGLRENFARLNANQRDEQRIDLSERIKFWLHDYLATCTAFFKYSLVAIFHADSRANTELL